MAWLDKGLKQRIVGAFVLIALAVVFLPMLLTRENERRHVQVEAPPMPVAPEVVPVAVEPVQVPEPVVEVEPDTPPMEPAGSVAAVEPVPVKEPVAVKEPTVPDQQRLDTNSLPVSWSVQLASLSSRKSADDMVAKLRSQGYNGYVRSADGKHRVLVGPLIERAAAERLRDQLKRQKLDGFIVRFEPEKR